VLDEPALESRPRRDPAASLWWLLATPLLPWLAVLPAGRFALPLLAPLPVFVAFGERVRERRYGAAWLALMGWAALLSAGTIAFTEMRPAMSALGILHGPDYRAEMFQWIVRGDGKETTPARFVPEQLAHLAAFVVLTLVSGGYLGLVLGAYLIDYMSYFVGSFAARSAPLAGALAAWVPWSAVRVAAFVLVCCVLARPLLVRAHRSSSDAPEPLRLTSREWLLLALAGAGIVTDLVTKALLAPWWGHFLRGMLRH